MRKHRLATVFLFTVGGVLIPGIANAATSTTTDTTGSTTMSPVVIIAGGTSGTTTTDTSSTTSPTVVPPSVSPGPSDKAAHDAAEAAKKAAHDAAEAAKKAAHDAAEAAKQAAHDAAEAAKGPKDAKPGADVSTGPVAPPGSNAAWLNDASLFDGTGRKWG